ncbi:MAG: glycine--tRNA ligase [Chloroflexota bacterium]|nr:MAG: glycine--tRNA ligase [Chloroflexota bacterium]
MADLETIVNLCKRRGFVFPSSEIYGGFGGFWDYGPLGVELKRNVKDAWWRAIVQRRDDVVGLDSSIIMSPRAWHASGHVETFTDPLVDCKQCRKRSRSDELNAGRCPFCGGEVTAERRFNLMFKTFIGPVEDEASVAYLRPETAAGIFVNFRNAQATARKKLPFGIAQIGKTFRNEITPGKFIFRDREFEQMEVEYFTRPEQSETAYRQWIQDRVDWYVGLGIRREHLSLYEQPTEELAHYSRGTTDILYAFPFGESELEGIAMRGDFDLGRHQAASGEDLSYFDDEANERYLPHVVEPSAGVDRSVLAFLLDAYHEEPDKEGTRVVLKFHPALAPFKVAILPLSRKETLTPLAKGIWADLRRHWMVAYDDAQSIGRRYRRQDEIGTPFCVTVDFDSLQDNCVTIRDRDAMTQVRVAISDLVPALREKLDM